METKYSVEQDMQNDHTFVERVTLIHYMWGFLATQQQPTSLNANLKRKQLEYQVIFVLCLGAMVLVL